MPVSNQNPGYTGLPRESLGPAKPLATAATCSRVRHDAVFGPLQASSAGLNLQPIGSEIIPSAIPSLASQAWSSESTTSLRSLSDKAREVCGLPSSSLGAT